MPYRKVAAPAQWMNAVSYRMKRGEAILLCHCEDGQQLDAYGWIQDWRPFRRKFGALAHVGTMLGPYWTAPGMRGRGLYGELLAHSLFLCSRERPILICTSPENKASQRGIEKAGFRPFGEWELSQLLGMWTRLHRILT